jgi:hypothetical protein
LVTFRAPHVVSLELGAVLLQVAGLVAVVSLPHVLVVVASKLVVTLVWGHIDSGVVSSKWFGLTAVNVIG